MCVVCCWLLLGVCFVVCCVLRVARWLLRVSCLVVDRNVLWCVFDACYVVLVGGCCVLRVSCPLVVVTCCSLCWCLFCVARCVLLVVRSLLCLLRGCLCTVCCLLLVVCCVFVVACCLLLFVVVWSLRIGSCLMAVVR